METSKKRLRTFLGHLCDDVLGVSVWLAISAERPGEGQSCSVRFGAGPEDHADILAFFHRQKIQAGAAPEIAGIAGVCRSW